jgi:SGNH hydrolase-like domain, acetyltransferase AlgX
LLPLIGIVTILLIAGSVELAARRMFKVSETSSLKCLVLNDPSTGVRAIPNSTCSEKIYESDLTEYEFNSRGHRAGFDYGPKSPDTYRIVLVGSSFSEGLWSPRERTYAALLPAEISARTGRKVELYNEGMQWGTPHNVDLRFDEVLAAKPDMILWTVTPWDVDNASLLIPYVARQFDPALAHDEPAASITQRVLKAFRSKSILQAIKDGWSRAIGPFNDTRTAVLLQHFLYKSQSQYLKHYLMQDESNAFLQTQPGPAFVENLSEFGQYAADLAARSKAAGVPLVVVLVPQRAQAAMISMGTWPAGFDPYKLGEEIRTHIESNGAIYIDALHGFRTIPNPEQYYFPVDGHITSEGHALLTHIMAQAISSGAVPNLGKATATAVER